MATLILHTRRPLKRGSIPRGSPPVTMNLEFAIELTDFSSASPGVISSLASPSSAGKVPAMLNELWDSDATRLKKFRDKLQAMTDQQLLDYGRDCGDMCQAKYMRVSFEPDPWLEKLREARAEWRRRHPKQ